MQNKEAVSNFGGVKVKKQIYTKQKKTTAVREAANKSRLNAKKVKTRLNHFCHNYKGGVGVSLGTGRQRPAGKK